MCGVVSWGAKCAEEGWKTINFLNSFITLGIILVLNILTHRSTSATQKSSRPSKFKEVVGSRATLHVILPCYICL